VPSSTSSSNVEGFAAHRAPNIPVLKVIIAVIALSVMIASGLELFWSAQGVQPSLRNTPEVWSLEVHRWMDRRPGSAPAVILLGSSRVQCGVDSVQLSRELPEMDVYNLSVGGTRSLEALKFLSQHGALRAGDVVVAEFWPLAQLGAMDRAPYQQKWRLFEQGYTNPSFSQDIEATLDVAMESTLRSVHPELNLHHVFTHALSKRRVLMPLETMRIDRFIALDFVHQEASRLARMKSKHAHQFGQVEPMTADAQLELIHEFEVVIQEIQAQGAKVMLFHPVVSGVTREREQDLLEQQAFQLDALRSVTDAYVSYEESSTMVGLECPDEIHLGQEDIPAQTSYLSMSIRKMIPGE